MARKNIFELLDTRWDLKEELARFYKLFDENYVISVGPAEYTLKEFVDSYCFEDWKNRGRFIDVDDYLESLDFNGLYRRAITDIESSLTYIEIIYNFLYIASKKIESTNEFKYYTGLITLQDNMNLFLEHYNYAASIFEDKEQVIVSENDSAVTATAEISNPETAYQIVRYNHHSLKGDLKTKKEILLYLASELEPKRTTLDGINKAFKADIFALLNNLNLRHNNCDPDSAEFKQYIAEMPAETLEEWYDELYQMILLAELELDHLARKDKIAELKTHF